MTSILKAREAVARNQKAKLPIGVSKGKKENSSSTEAAGDDDKDSASASMNKKLTDEELLIRLGARLGLTEKATADNAKEWSIEDRKRYNLLNKTMKSDLFDEWVRSYQLSDDPSNTTQKKSIADGIHHRLLQFNTGLQSKIVVDLNEAVLQQHKEKVEQLRKIKNHNDVIAKVHSELKAVGDWTTAARGIRSSQVDKLEWVIKTHKEFERQRNEALEVENLNRTQRGMIPLKYFAPVVPEGGFVVSDYESPSKRRKTSDHEVVDKNTASSKASNVGMVNPVNLCESDDDGELGGHGTANLTDEVSNSNPRQDDTVNHCSSSADTHNGVGASGNGTSQGTAHNAATANVVGHGDGDDDGDESDVSGSTYSPPDFFDNDYMNDFQDEEEETPPQPVLGNNNHTGTFVPPTTPVGQGISHGNVNLASGTKRKNDTDTVGGSMKTTVVNVTSNLAILSSLEHEEVSRWIDKVKIHLANDGGIRKWSAMISQHAYHQLPLLFAKVLHDRFGCDEYITDREKALRIIEGWSTEYFLTTLAKSARGHNEGVSDKFEAFNEYVRSYKYYTMEPFTSNKGWGRMMNDMHKYVQDHLQDSKELEDSKKMSATADAFVEGFKATGKVWGPKCASRLKFAFKEYGKDRLTWNVITGMLNSMLSKATDLVAEVKTMGLFREGSREQDREKSSGSDRPRTDKKRKREEGGGDDRERVDCTMCGRRHPLPCALSTHPNANRSKEPWASSQAGKAWKAKFPDDQFLSYKKTISGEPWVNPNPLPPRGGEKKGEKGKNSHQKKGKQYHIDTLAATDIQDEERSDDAQTDTLIEVEVRDCPAKFKFRPHSLVCETVLSQGQVQLDGVKHVLFDTGASGLNGNYVSHRIAEEIEKAGGFKRKVNRKVEVCSCLEDFCTSCSEVMRMSVLVKLNNKVFQFTSDFHVAIMNDFDIIIGTTKIMSHMTLAQIVSDRLFSGLVASQATPSGTNSSCGVDVSDNTASMKGDGDKVRSAEVDGWNARVFRETVVDESGRPTHKLVYRRPIRQPDEVEWGWEEKLIIAASKMSVGSNTAESKSNIPIIHESVDPTLKEPLRKLLEKFEHVFSRALNPEPAKTSKLRIQVSDEWYTTKNSTSVRIQSPERSAEIKRQVDDMLAAGIIRKSNARHWSHVLLTPKKVAGTWRFCIDFRRLNSCTLSAHWPLPNIKEMLQRIGTARPRIFGVMDLTKGYYQIEIEEDSKHLTAFLTIFGLYEWGRMAMGLKGAAPLFQRIIASEVLRELYTTIAEGYIDDVMTFGHDNESFLINLEKVLQRFSDHGITLNPDKCCFGVTEIEYVGHVINEKGCTFSPDKLTHVFDFPKPTTSKELKSFLGLANYFRDHVFQHSDIVRPLTDMLLKYNPRKPLEWTEETSSAFDRIRVAIKNCPMLFWVNPEYESHVFTDASKFAYAVYVCQRHKDKEYPIAMMSRTFSGAQKNWDTKTKEAFPIYDGLKEFEYLLQDATFVLHTDHRNLTYIKDSSDSKVMRWKLKIQEYDFTLEHIAGVNNVVADMLSRVDTGPESDYVIDEPMKVCRYLAHLKMVDQDDIQTNSLNASWEEQPIPDDKYNIIKQAHNGLIGHHGVDNTIVNILKNNPKWDHMRSHVRKFIRQCDVCQRHDDRKNVTVTRGYSTSGKEPFECINLDIRGPLPPDEHGNKYIVIITDTFSRYLTAWPVENNGALAVANALMQHHQFFSIPIHIKTDQGSEFMNDMISQFLSMLGPEHIGTISYSKEENSIVERSIKEVNRWIKSTTTCKRWPINKWSSALPFAVRIHNNTIVISIGCTPHQIIFGWRFDMDRGILLPPEERPDIPKKDLQDWVKFQTMVQDETIAKAQQLVKIHEDEVKDTLHQTGSKRVARSDEPTEFQEGEYVMVCYPHNAFGTTKPNKLLSNWRGPMQVVSRDGNNYQLRNLVTKKLEAKEVHLIKKYHYDPLRTVPEQVALNDYTQHWEVEEVIGHTGNMKQKKSLLFEVKWEGFDSSHNTQQNWESLRSNIKLHEYLRKRGLQEHIPKNLIVEELFV